jgi:ribosomal protein S18 acetylase RimI-like enzyme
VPAERRREALERLGRGGVHLSDEQARGVSRAAEQAGVNFEQLWGAFDEHDRMQAAALLVYRPGRTAMIFSSPPRREAELPTHAALLQRLADSPSPDNASLVQALVDPDDRMEIEALTAAGFGKLADLMYMQRSVPRRPGEPPPLPPGVTLETYRPDLRDQFVQALERSYVQTLDCPMLRGLRETDDVLAGHMSIGQFDPDLWTLVRHEGRPEGLMLLNIAEQRVMELIYLGIGPTLRRQGVARALLKRALRWAAARSVRTMSLAVDTDNGPAMALYQQLGFYRVTRRVALVRPVTD